MERAEEVSTTCDTRSACVKGISGSGGADQTLKLSNAAVGLVKTPAMIDQILFGATAGDTFVVSTVDCCDSSIQYSLMRKVKICFCNEIPGKGPSVQFTNERPGNQEHKTDRQNCSGSG